MNLLKLPVDVLFSILIELPNKSLPNFSITCKQANTLFNDQRFWKRKIVKDYSDVGWKKYNYKCIKELYKRLYLKYGQFIDLINGKQVMFLVRKIIWGNIVYGIDENCNLRIIHRGEDLAEFDKYLLALGKEKVVYIIDAKCNSKILYMVGNLPEFDKYLPLMDGTGGETIVLRNVVDFVRNDFNGLILTRNRDVFEIKCKGVWEKLESNVKEIGGDDFTFYYVNMDSELYVKSTLYDGRLRTFTYVANVKSVCLNNGQFFYTDMENKSFSGLETEWDIIVKVNVKQLIVRLNVWYVLTEHGLIDGYDFNMDMNISFGIGNTIVEKLYFNNLNNPVYAILGNLDCVDITRHWETNVFRIMTNTLYICKNYLIILPLDDNPITYPTPKLDVIDL